MTNIGSRPEFEQEFPTKIAPVHSRPETVSTTNLSPQAKATARPRSHRLWESLTASLDLACRGYLCMQIVDCDPVSDPDCSASGKKTVVRQVPPQREQ